jgi:amidohydrolase
VNGLDLAAGYADYMSGHRRWLHAHPEVGLALPLTHDYISSTLVGLGFRPERHDAGGVTVRIPGESDAGRVKVLRTDMDALPVTETTGLEYASRHPGSMHACGHDLHMATMLGAAALFRDHPPRTDVVLAFQPGEERDRGALATLEHDNLRFDEPAVAFAIHVNAAVEPGTVEYRPGVFMASADTFQLSLRGDGGHAAVPELAANPIDAGASFVDTLRQRVDAIRLDDTVLTITRFDSGVAANVIPAECRITGSIRYVRQPDRQRLGELVSHVAGEIAEVYGIRSGLEFAEGYPPLVCDEAFVSELEHAVRSGLPGIRLREMARPSMVTEDFAYFVQRWPGAMVYLGAATRGHRAFNHAATVVFDESAMVTGLALHALVANELD